MSLEEEEDEKKKVDEEEEKGLLVRNELEEKKRMGREKMDCRQKEVEMERSAVKEDEEGLMRILDRSE